jgi:hypothetical protein
MDVGGHQGLVRRLGKLGELVGLSRPRRDLRITDLTDGGPDRLVLLGRPVESFRIRHVGSLAPALSVNLAVAGGVGMENNLAERARVGD